MRARPWILAAFLTLTFVGPAASAKSFILDRFHSDITVRTDGTARVTESLTYRFDGSFSYAFRNIPLRPGDRVYNVSVSEAGTDYAESISEIPGSYTVRHAGNEAVITWYYRARNEIRTFLLSYTIEGAVRRHADIAEFYQTLFSNETGRRVGEVSATVSLPGDIDRSELRVFAHGPLHGVIEIVDGTTVRASVAPLPRGRFFDVRVLTPSRVFDGMTASATPMLARIIAQEAEWAKEADRRRVANAERRKAYLAEKERRRRLAGVFLPIAVVVGLGALALWFAYFRRYGWPHDVPTHAVPGEIPSDHPPAILSYLLARTVGGPAMVATLVDLSERGFLKISETQRQKTGWRGNISFETDYRFDRGEGRGEPLRSFERSLLEFMLDTVGTGRSFTMSGLKTHARKHRTDVRKWFMEWNKEVKEAGKREEFFEPYPAGAIVVNVISGVAVLGVGIAFVAMTKSPSGAPAIIGGFLQALLSASLNRRTPEGRRLLLAWKKFRVHLKGVSKAMGTVTLASGDWARYLSVGILFGMHKKLLPSLSISDAQGRHGYPVWYHAVHSSADGATGITSLADGLSTMITSVTTTMSSSTGAGGGAGAGGGGGAGGGSAGAG